MTSFIGGRCRRGPTPPQSLTLDDAAESGPATSALPRGSFCRSPTTPRPTVTDAPDRPLAELQISPPDRSVTILVDAEDDLGASLKSISRATGAFVVSRGRGRSQPPLGTAFRVVHDPGAPRCSAPGEVLNLRATAVDLSGNASAPVSLALTVTALPEVTFGPSGDPQCGRDDRSRATAVGAGTSRRSLCRFSVDGTIATATPLVVIPAGQSDATIAVSGVADGTTFVNALIQGVQRGSATVVVEGGIVTGTVLDPQLAPVAGAKISLTEGMQILTTETDAAGVTACRACSVRRYR